MRRRISGRLAQALSVLGVLLALSLVPGAAAAAPAQPKASAQSARPSKATRKAPRSRAKKPAPPAPAKPSDAAAPAESTVVAPGAAPAQQSVKTEVAAAGEKTYTFGAQEIEGRLKAPQILYFLRRVRAQFDPAPLGHRSFLLELSDTRRHPALE